MTEANPKLGVYVVVDRGGDRHCVKADRMLTEGREVTFTVEGREVGSFYDPLSAKVFAADAAPAPMSRPGPPPPPPMRNAGSTPAQRVVSLVLLVMLGGLLFFAAGFKAAGGVLLG